MKLKISQDQSLLTILMNLFPESSKNQLRGFVKQGRVSVDSIEIKKMDTLVKKGQEVAISPRKLFLSMDLKILYQDKDLIIVEKPAGLLSVATDFDKKKTAHGILKQLFKPKRIFPVHRLDRETSGVMVFAFTEKAKEGLKKQLFDHAMNREYIAVVHGIIRPKQGSWQSFLAEDRNYYVKSKDEGKFARTHYKVIKERKERTLLYLKLETGRKNQIRVHCAESGHPIFGDKKYSDKKDWAKRLYLHAVKLQLEHPILLKKMVFESSLPIEFQELV